MHSQNQIEVVMILRIQNSKIFTFEYHWWLRVIRFWWSRITRRSNLVILGRWRTKDAKWIKWILFNMVILGMKMLLMLIWFDFLVNYFRRFGSLMKRLFINIIRFRCRLIIYRLIIYYFWSWGIGFGSGWFRSCCGLGCGYNLIMCVQNYN